MVDAINVVDNLAEEATAAKNTMLSRPSMWRILTDSKILKPAPQFLDRKLLYNTNIGPVKHLVSDRVPQGSALGSLLWNVMYDHELHIKLPLQATLISYAEHIAIVVVDKDLEDV